MAAKLKLARVGKVHSPSFRLIVVDSRKPTNSDFIELVGHIDFVHDNKVTNLKEDRILYWLSVGAQPTESAKSILKTSGIMRKFAESKRKVQV
ncbi:MAG TPA: 30S ribosomal protein S16 [Caldisericia bacterium]|nr:30S ribosomal protein S16 [bacterium]NMD14137.1 30S ribosomal protein S16 [Caldisericales bacterium]HNW31682.1 30S ribosomal protein S16 [Caldisericia bacterium]HOC80012.1 30S ribosomal protein S16 [Caldisericia bacterium]HOG70858.1 30S ribosomal protein S16 [Caldisericia bacterium]